MDHDGAVAVIANECRALAPRRSVTADVARALSELGVAPDMYAEGSLFARSPVDGSRIGKLRSADHASIDQALQRAQEAADTWAHVAPGQRAEFVRRICERLRKVRDPLVRLVALETGKTLEDSYREVSFTSVCCDKAFAAAREIGQSVLRTDQTGQWLNEAWRPLGVTGCISPFNRPLTQFAGVCFTSLVCGNAVVWKPSERAPLSALALQTLIMDVAREMDEVPDDLVSLLFGGPDVGKTLAEDFRLRFLDAATSIAAGRLINTKIAQSFARGALSLGGNNAAIICASADLPAAVNALVASATLSGGQHVMCTRRVFVHRDLHDVFVDKLKKVFARLPIGDPRTPGVMMGPLIDRLAFERMQRALTAARNAGARVTGGARIDLPEHPGGYYVRPVVVEMAAQDEIALRENLVPIVFVTPFDTLTQALEMDRASEAGMASAIFSRNMSEVDQFVRVTSCGMLNVNTLHSGYEMGIAPIGAGASAGGRLPSTSSWKVFMRRCFITMNMSSRQTAPDTLGMVERGDL